MKDAEQLLNRLSAVHNVVVLTGAGISAESGVPTFREAQSGLWARYRPEELATREAFADHPQRVLDWYRWRRELIQKAQPNAGHTALARMEEIIHKQGGEFHLITQNVDNLHQRAGNQSVLELHGNIFQFKCFDCEKKQTPPDEMIDLPRCQACQGLLRPDVVWFGENLSAHLLEKAVAVCQQADLLFLIGTSAVVQPAASLPLYALREGAFLVEINPAPTPLSPRCDLTLRIPAGEILPELVNV